MITCSSCHSTFDDGLRFCTRCGTALGAPSAAADLPVVLPPPSPAQMVFPPVAPVPTARIAEGASPKRRRTWAFVAVSAVVIALIAVIGGIVVLRGGGEDSTGAPGSLRPVRSDPTSERVTFEVEGDAGPVGYVGGLLVMESYDDAEVIGVDPATGSVEWRRDATDSAVFGDSVFVLDDRDLIRLDAEGRDVGESYRTAQDASIVIRDDALAVRDGDELTLLDERTLEVVASEVWRLSPSGNYGLRLDYRESTDDYELELLDISSNRTVGGPIISESAFVAVLDDGRRVAVQNGDLEIYAIDGTLSASARVDEDAFLAGVIGDRAIVRGDGRLTAWTLSGEPEELSARVDEGDVAPTDRIDRFIVKTSDEGGPAIDVVSIDDDGLTRLATLDGFFHEQAGSVVYMFDDGRFDAYDVADPDRPLWSLRYGDDQSFGALSGKIAIFGYDAERDKTTVDLYG